MKTILVVDDREDTLGLMKSALEKSGYPAIGVESGKEALEIIKEKNIALVISDIRMPVMDGMQLLKAIRKNPETKTLKVLMMTASKTSKEDQKEFMDAGADGFLLKPVTIDELRQEIKKLLA